MSEKIRVEGIFFMNVFKIINDEKHLIESYVDKNLVVTVGKRCLCLLLANAASTYISQIAFGEGTAEPAVSDTTLTAGYYIKSITDYVYPLSNEITFNWELLSTEANGMSITEYGLYTNGDYLFSRKIRSPIVKDADIIFEGTWKITFI